MDFQLQDLQELSARMKRLREALFALTRDKPDDAFDEWLHRVDNELDRIEVFVREETFGRFGTYDATHGLAHLTSVPAGARYECESAMTCRFFFPLWLFRAREKGRPLYHRQGFIREAQFWYALIEALVPRAQRFRRQKEDEVLDHAHCEVIIYLHRRNACADWDKYQVEPMLNAFAAHDVIRSDHPHCLSLTYKYQFVEHVSQEKVEVCVARTGKRTAIQGREKQESVGRL